MVGTNLTRALICDESAIHPGTWATWFPYYEKLLEPAVYNCFTELHDHPLNNSQMVEATSIPNCPGAYNLISCVQDALPSQVQLAMASAQVILGLAPTLISTLSPSVGEISMLSANRPVLSFMLSLGCPAVFSIRSLEYDDPIALLQRPAQGLFRQRRVLQPGKREAWISASQYALALLAIINVLIVDGQLGFQTVSVWKAGGSYLVYLWSIFAIIPHGLSALACYYSRSMRDERDANRGQRREENAATGFLGARFTREVTICAAKRRRSYLEHKKEEPAWVLSLNLAAAFIGFLLLIYGTILFSSLLFIGPLDALGAIVRYLVSTLLCRCILAFELNGIMAVELGQGGSDHKLPGHELMSYQRVDSFGSNLTRTNSDDVWPATGIAVLPKAFGK